MFCTTRKGNSASRNRTSRGPPRRSSDRSAVSPIEAKKISSSVDLVEVSNVKRRPAVSCSSSIASATSRPPTIGAGMLKRAAATPGRLVRCRSAERCTPRAATEARRGRSSKTCTMTMPDMVQAGHFMGMRYRLKAGEGLADDARDLGRKGAATFSHARAAGTKNARIALEPQSPLRFRPTASPATRTAPNLRSPSNATRQPQFKVQRHPAMEHVAPWQHIRTKGRGGIGRMTFASLRFCNLRPFPFPRHAPLSCRLPTSPS